MAASGKNVDQILHMLESAKLHPNDLDPRVQVIHFGPEFSSNEFRLLELDPAAEKYVEENQSLILRGMPDDSAVLCTKDTTFELKEAETSNSLLLTDKLLSIQRGEKKGSVTPRKVPMDPDGIVEREIIAKNVHFVANAYLEMKKIKPFLGKIREQLEKALFRGFEEEADVDKSARVRMGDLLESIAASEAEIQAYLDDLKIFYIDGYIRLAHPDYLFTVLSHIIMIIDENGWSKNKIAKGTVIAQLTSLYPVDVQEKIFQWFFIPVSHDDSMEEDGLVIADQGLYMYNDKEICRLYGEVLLRRGNQFSCRDFIKSWQDSVPTGLKVNLKQLQTIAIVDNSLNPPIIKYFPEHELPPVIQDRLTFLFHAKPKWKHDEILPYITSLAVSEQQACLLLTKYCRTVSIDGCKMYCSKYAKW